MGKTERKHTAVISAIATMTKIHLLSATPMGILIVYYDNLWQFRVLANNRIYGEAKHYYTAEAAEAAGREWAGAGW